jgi:hypothetical protein
VEVRTEATSSRYNRTTAKLFSERFLRDARFEPAAIEAVPLRQFAGFLNLRVVETPTTLGPSGSLWHTQFDLFDEGEFDIRVRDSSSRRRFTVAHEIAHRIVEVYGAQHSLDATYSRNEQIVDDVASRILLPDPLLLLAVDSGNQLELGVNFIMRLHKKLGVSVSCFLKRINDLVAENRINLRNSALLAWPASSAKHNRDYAPRVVVSCLPRGWYIPANKRLLTLGLKGMSQLWDAAPTFTKGVAEDQITVWKRREWHPAKYGCTFEYIFFVLSDQRTRVLFTCFDGLEPTNPGKSIQGENDYARE